MRTVVTYRYPGSDDRSLLLDAYAAAEDGLIPAELVPPRSTPVDGWDAAEAAMLDYARTHDLAGYDERRHLDRGVPDHCPSWCVLSHDEVVLCLPGSDEGRDHHGPAVEVGTLYDAEDAVRVYVEQTGGGDGKHPSGVHIEVDRLVPTFTPAQARELAAVLLRLADEVEALT